MIYNPCPGMIPNAFLLSLLENYRDINGEQETKNKMIEPLLEYLGYNIKYADDIQTEITCDIGIKKEKIDYVVYFNNQPIILIEAKDWHEKLSEVYINQLYRYFAASNCKLAILTNGIDYWFFSDFQKENIMDKEPFHKLNIFGMNQKDADILIAICKVRQCTYGIDKYIIEKKTERLLNDPDKMAALIACSLNNGQQNKDAIKQGLCNVLGIRA